jgi:hypothetical protein
LLPPREARAAGRSTAVQGFCSYPLVRTRHAWLLLVVVMLSAAGCWWLRHEPPKPAIQWNEDAGTDPH